jgi:hypothetical protein
MRMTFINFRQPGFDLRNTILHQAGEKCGILHNFSDYGQSRPKDEGSAFFCSLAGYRKPWDDNKIKILYPTRQDYLDKVNAQVDGMIKERFLTKSDGVRIKEEAQKINAW